MGDWNAETAEWYAKKYGEYATNRLTAETLEVARDATVVDVGCGTASALRHLLAKVSEGRLFGIDPVPRMIDIARERCAAHPGGERIVLHVAPAHALPLPEACADVVLALDSYDHWGAAHQAAGLREVRRVLVSGGRFVVVKDAGVPMAKAAKDAFLDALEEAGFEVVSEVHGKTREASFTTWVCAARRPPTV